MYFTCMAALDVYKRQSSDKFLFKGAENGLAVDQDQLKADILAALSLSLIHI